LYAIAAGIGQSLLLLAVLHCCEQRSMAADVRAI
jgi:hypothetical protein